MQHGSEHERQLIDVLEALYTTEALCWAARSLIEDLLDSTDIAGNPTSETGVLLYQALRHYFSRYPIGLSRELRRGNGYI